MAHHLMLASADNKCLIKRFPESATFFRRRFGKVAWGSWRVDILTEDEYTEARKTGLCRGNTVLRNFDPTAAPTQVYIDDTPPYNSRDNDDYEEEYDDDGDYGDYDDDDEDW
jgi:hypothetical protein